jgi:nicotinamidase-related amidase
MQNFFLSAAMGRPRGEGHAAEDVLLKYGIPASRQAGIQVLWMTWGITEAGLQSLPPTIWRIFGWQNADVGHYMVPDDSSDAPVGGGVLQRKERKCDDGIGSPPGKVKLKNGSTVDAGRMLIHDQWNTELHGPLQQAFMDGTKAKTPDVRFHKERLSGFWDASSPCHRFLKKQGITTLLFTGVNTDQCVLASLQDACNQGWDTILLMDGCGTTSPGYTKQMVEYNCQKSWGFVSSCKALFDGAKKITKPEGADSVRKVESKDEV